MNAAVLVTGAAGAIGKAICQVFAQAGYCVIATDVRQADGPWNSFIAADLEKIVASSEERRAFFSAVMKAAEGNSLRAIVNNAAVQLLGEIEKLPVEDLRRSLDVNVAAAYALIQLLSEAVGPDGTGAVVNIGSIHARLTKRRFAAYATSKAALRGLTQAAALDLAPRIRVNIIEPAACDTPMLRAGFEGLPEAYAKLEHYHPMQRVASPSEIAAAALFLASEQSGFITGAVLPVDGGIAVMLSDPDQEAALRPGVVD